MTHPPEVMNRLKDRLVAEFNAESVEIEPLETPNRFSIIIVSPEFAGVPDLQRQDLAWKVVDEVCSREESMMVSAIWALAPGEITTYLESL